MQHLVRTELRALANLWLHPSGRKELIGVVITLSCIVLGAMLVSSRALSSDVFQAINNDASGLSARIVFSAAFAPAIFLAFGLSMSMIRTGLFDRPDGDLLLTSPVPPHATLWLVFIRAIITCTLFGLPMTLPVVIRIGLGVQSDASPLISLVLGIMGSVALVLVLAPILAAITMLQVVLMRWFASPRLRFALQSTSALSMLAFSVLAMMGLINQDDTSEAIERLVEAQRLPALFEVPSSFPALVLGYVPAPATVLFAGVFAILPFVLLRLAGPLYARAYENATVAARPLFRPRSTNARGGIHWPTSVAASIIRRDRVQLFSDPGGALVFLFLAILIVWTHVSGIGGRSSAALGEQAIVLGALVRFGITLILTSMLVCPFATTSDRAQLPLIAASPASREAILRGRLLGIAVPLLWCWLVTIAAMLGTGAHPTSALAFVGLSIPLIGASLGVLCATSTIPAFAAHNPDSPGAQLAAVLGPQMLVLALLIGLYTLFLRGEKWARHEMLRVIETQGAAAGVPMIPWLFIGAVVGAGLLTFAIGYWIAVRNTCRTLGALDH